MTHTMYDEEIDEFNSGFNAYKSGVPVENAPETTHDMWRPGYAFAAFDDLRAEVERLRAEYDSEVSEFNAGFDAYKAGLPLENEPETKHDLWRAGYAFSAFDDLRAEVSRLRANLKMIESCAARDIDALFAENERLRAERDTLREAGHKFSAAHSYLGIKEDEPNVVCDPADWAAFDAALAAACLRRQVPALQADNRLAVAERAVRLMQEEFRQRATRYGKTWLYEAVRQEWIDAAAVARRAVEELDEHE